jgi:hypothetical protein
LEYGCQKKKEGSKEPPDYFFQSARGLARIKVQIKRKLMADPGT